MSNTVKVDVSATKLKSMLERLQDFYPVDLNQISGYNSFTYYEEFDQGSTSAHTASPQSLYVTQSIAGNVSLTAPNIVNSPAGTQGCLVINSASNTVVGAYLRLCFQISIAWKLAAMIENGFKAEFRFMLEDDSPTRSVNFGWINFGSNSIDVDGTVCAAGVLIKNRELFLVRRQPNGTFTTKTSITTLDLNTAYTVSVDTTSGSLVMKLINNKTNTIVDERTVPKWTGWDGINQADLYTQLFTSAGAGNRTSFGVIVGPNTSGLTTKLLTLDAMFVHCPKIR